MKGMLDVFIVFDIDAMSDARYLQRETCDGTTPSSRPR